MNAVVGEPALESLSPVSRTAWLTAYTHYACGAGWGLHRPVSNWLIGRWGKPPFHGALSFYTLHGIPARAQWIDTAIRRELDTARAAGQKAQVWVMGAGLDSRWEWMLEGYAGTVSRYLEFDLPDLMRAKDAELRRSPWSALWQKVEQHPGDVIAGLPDNLPRTTERTIIVLEGLLDYFDQDQKRHLFETIRDRVPEAVLLLDAQNAWLQQTNNRKSRAATGTENLNFATVPVDPVRFYTVDLGCDLKGRSDLLPRLLRHRWSWLRFVPMPRKLRTAYVLMALRPRAARPALPSPSTHHRRS